MKGIRIINDEAYLEFSEEFVELKPDTYTIVHKVAAYTTEGELLYSENHPIFSEEKAAAHVTEFALSMLEDAKCAIESSKSAPGFGDF